MLLAVATTLLVLDLVPTGADPAQTRVASEEVVAAAFAARPGEVATSMSVRDVLGIEAQRQLFGCDDGACAVQVAGALGAREVLAGSIAVLDGLTLVQLRLIDTTDARVLGRTTAQVKRASDLPESVRRATFEILKVPYVPAVRQKLERMNEASLAAGVHFGGGPGGFVWAQYAWNRAGFWLGIEGGGGRFSAEVREQDLPGFPDIVSTVHPTWLGLGVQARRGFPILDWLQAYGRIGLGADYAFETVRHGPGKLGFYARPAAGLELSGDGDFGFFLEGAWVLGGAHAQVTLENLDPLGQRKAVDTALAVGGPEIGLGVKLAF